jgi:DNA-binding response OmpR family regulator
MATDRPEAHSDEAAQGGPASQPQAGTRLGGARADFVASLGRKVADARSLLTAIATDPSSRPPRDELRRRLHALGAAARMLHFDAMARCIVEACAVLDRVAQGGTATEPDIAHVAQALDDMPALAWGEAPPAPREAAPSGASLPASTSLVLVVGGEPIAEALSEDGESPFECERTEHAQAALGMARSLAPDVVIVDSDIDGALDLVESLLDDPLTEPVPIIVLGRFRAPEQAARYVALGVAKTLAKPVSPDSLRRACQEVIDQREGRTLRVTLGEPTLEQLGERLAEEVRRALVDAVDGAARSCRVPLGEGTEVLGAVWGAIARVREVVTMRTDGVVRYAGEGPEGAVALAPWLHHDVAAADRAQARGRGAAADVRLDKRRVIVADDDPGVTWFIADLLRAAGCTVHEALDGNTALQLAYKVSPELVVSDILMPGLDGFALCRALKRDVALRDVPVILLSWKEDLLQRVRELGASAAAYLRKESDARAIIARVREVLRARARVEARIRADGEVRGRLDGLTVRSLLELVCAMRPSSRVSVRDASFLYEIEIRNGAPRRATRTAGDGSFLRGERVLAAMLGVGAGRFTVAPSNASIPVGDLAGSLAEQLIRPVAIAREALAATTGARTMNVERVSLDEDAVAGYLLATPQHERDLIKRIAQGASLRDMLLKGEVAPGILEDVLADLAARGAITAVRDARGNDVLGPAVERALGALTREVGESAPPSMRRTPSPLPTSELLARELPAIAEASRARKAVPRSDAPSSQRGPSSSENGPPSSLEDAVMRAMSDRSPATSAPVSPEQPPIVEPSQLRPRSSSNPPDPESGETQKAAPLPSLPPDAIVPAASSGDMPAAAAAEQDAQEGGAAARGAGTVPTGEPSIPVALESSDMLTEPSTLKPTERSATVPSRARAAGSTSSSPLTASSRTQGARPLPAPKHPASPPGGERRWVLPLVILVFALVAAAGYRWVLPIQDAPLASTAGGPLGQLPVSGTVATVTFGEIPSDFTDPVPAGDGVLDIMIAEDAALTVDGRDLRPPHQGKSVRLALAAGLHEVRSGTGAQEKIRYAEVRAGSASRLDLVQAP